MQRADRNFGELLQEFRVTQTGVQILFAFLLSLSFTPRFASVTNFQRDLYVGTLTSSAITTATLIAPVAAHRIQFQRGRKVELVRLVHRCLLAGLTFLLLTMAGALLLVLDVVVGTPLAFALTTAVTACFVALWVVLPSCLRFADSPHRTRPSGAAKRSNHGERTMSDRPDPAGEGAGGCARKSSSRRCGASAS